MWSSWKFETFTNKKSFTAMEGKAHLNIYSMSKLLLKKNNFKVLKKFRKYDNLSQKYNENFFDKMQIMTNCVLCNNQL